MRTIVVAACVIFANLPSASAEDAAKKESYHYQTTDMMRVRVYDATKPNPEDGIDDNAAVKIALPGLRFRLVKSVTKNDKKYSVVQFFPIVAEPPALKGDATYINQDDNTVLFYVEAADFDEATKSDAVRKSYDTWRPVPVFGATLSIPFKLRPRIDARRGQLGHNREIDTDVTIGGYAGLRFRFDRHNPYYMTPVINGGLVVLSLDQGNAPSVDTAGGTTAKGFTVGGGLIFELNGTQLGLLAGRDYAAGDIGNSWIYNGRTWYSLSIGFSFFSRSGSETVKVE